MKKVISFSTIVFFYFICISIYRVDAATINAADCSQTAVSNAIASAVSGDLVVIPSGTCSWSSPVTISIPLTIRGKTITLRDPNTYQVSATDNTIIQTNGFQVTAETGVRITGITFDGNVSGVATQPITLPTSPVGMRIDHNHFTYYRKVWNKGGGGGYLNVIFDNNRITQPGEENLYIVGAGNDAFVAGGVCGSSNPEKTTWIEDNEFVLETANIGNLIDMGAGARVAIRGNRVTGTVNYTIQDFIEAHGHCWGQRDGNSNAGVYCVEVSDNRFHKVKTQSNAAKILRTRGGKNYVYNNNAYDPGWTTGGIIGYWIQEVATDCNATPCAVQAHEDAGYHAVPLSEATNYTAGFCTTYPCPMQPNNSYNWNNTWDSGTVGVIVQGADAATYMAEDRDYWDDIGVGDTNFTKDVAANRIGTCTIQNSYWETDTKMLYRCTATNTWTFIYSPYNYPHPLTITPSHPSNLTIQ